MAAAALVPEVPVTVAVAVRPPVAVFWCVPGVVGAVVAAGLVVVAPQERYRGVDFANMYTYAYMCMHMGAYVYKCMRKSLCMHMHIHFCPGEGGGAS